jgi:hypothetical protein
VAYVSVSVNQSHERRLEAVTKYDYVPYMCLCRYFTLIKSGERAMKASVGASALLPDKSVQYQARKILKWAQHLLKSCRFLKWAQHLLKSCRLPEHRQGKHIKVQSLIYEEDIASKCRRSLKSQINDSIIAQSFAFWVKTIFILKPICLDLSW